jgi:hypothetical protein
MNNIIETLDRVPLILSEVTRGKKLGLRVVSLGKKHAISRMATWDFILHCH